jgi:hypothetical protein
MCDEVLEKKLKQHESGHTASRAGPLMGLLFHAINDGRLLADRRFRPGFEDLPKRYAAGDELTVKLEKPCRKNSPFNISHIVLCG